MVARVETVVLVHAFGSSGRESVRAVVADAGSRAHLVGISGGATVALLTYLEDPGRVASLVLSAGVAHAPRLVLLQRAIQRALPEPVLARLLRGWYSGGRREVRADRSRGLPPLWKADLSRRAEGACARRPPRQARRGRGADAGRLWGGARPREPRPVEGDRAGRAGRRAAHRPACGPPLEPAAARALQRDRGRVRGSVLGPDPRLRGRWMTGVRESRARSICGVVS